jgi:hypothetical protein
MSDLDARVRAAITIQTAWRGRRNRKQFNKLICKVRVQDHVNKAIKQDLARYRWHEAIQICCKRTHLRRWMKSYAQV